MYFSLCRSWTRYHAEDGDPWLHATSHPRDAGELRGTGKWGCRQQDQRRPPRKLQSQSVPQLCPKQSSHTIAVVTAHLFFIRSLSLHVGLCLLPRCSEPEGQRRWALTHRRLAEPTSSSPTTQVHIYWSACHHCRNTVRTWGGGEAGAGQEGWRDNTRLTLLIHLPPLLSISSTFLKKRWKQTWTQWRPVLNETEREQHNGTNKRTINTDWPKHQTLCFFLLLLMFCCTLKQTATLGLVKRPHSSKTLGLFSFSIKKKKKTRRTDFVQKIHKYI